MTIEGELIQVRSQKITPKVQLPEEKVTLSGDKVLVYPFSLRQQGSGTIAAENSIKDEENKTLRRFDLRSSVDRGTSIMGKNLYGFGKKRLGRITVGGEGRTGGHSGQSTEVADCCYLRVWETFQGTTDLVHPSQLFGLPLFAKLN